MKKISLLTLSVLILTACSSQTLKAGRLDYNQHNYSAALAKVEPLAEKGNPKAQYAVGYMYYYGQGVSANKSLGEDWISKAAAQGLPEAIKAEQIIKKQSEMNPLKDPN